MKLRQLHFALSAIALATFATLSSVPVSAATDPGASGEFKSTGKSPDGKTDRIDATAVAQVDERLGNCIVAPGRTCAYVNEAQTPSGQAVSDAAKMNLDRTDVNDLQPKFRRSRSR